MNKALLFFFVLFLSFSLFAQDAERINSPQPSREEIEMKPAPNIINPITIPTASRAVSWSEGFEGTTFPPAGWTVHTNDAGIQNWVRYTTSPIFGTASASVRWEGTTITNDDWLITHQFLVNQGDLFRFWAKQNSAATYVDSVQIFYTTGTGLPPAGFNYITTVVPSVTAAMFEIPINAYAGQNIRMAFRYFALNQFRLWVDSVYVETPLDNDVGMQSLSLGVEMAPGTHTPTAVVKNFGAIPQSFNVTLTITGGYTSTVTVTNLAPAATQQVTFTNWNAMVGAYQAKVFTQLATDQFKGNDTITRNIGVVQTLYHNGPMITHPTGGAGGAPASSIFPPLNSFGFNASRTAFIRIADDFTVPGDSIFNINSIDLFAYMTNSTITSPITGVNIRIWSGLPEQTGSVVVFGDSTSNHMSSTAWSGIYRVSSTTLTNTARPIMRVTGNVSVSLNPGTYWLDVAFTGSTAFTGPWVPPVTIEGQLTTGNAVQKFNNAWQPLSDSIWAQGMPFILKGTMSVIPVELVSFKASVDNNSVTLDWITATEVNNSGFEIQRSSNGSEFSKVGFISGNGTTTEMKSYSFTDGQLERGSYSYRLKQIDYDGTFEYSNVIEAEVFPVSQYSLSQNHPNPFNPSTKIEFSLAADSRVKLRIFDLLGQEVYNLTNNDMKSGLHTVNFDGSSLNSGVYFYQIEAEGINGVKFNEVKKMMLMK
jgi:hypothetical protein